MKKLIFVMLCLFSITSHATTYCQNHSGIVNAPGYSTYCTKSFLFTGTCNSTDQVYNWTVSGMPSWNIQPWENQPITIVGIEIMKYAGGPTEWFGSGDNSSPDILAWLGPNENHVIHDFPAGLGMPFPSIYTATSNDYIDLHGSCSGGAQANVYVTLSYVPQENYIPPPAPVTWNPLDKGSQIILSGGNLSASGSASTFTSVRATTSRSTGKFHYENVVTAVSGSTSVTGFGTAGMALSPFVGITATSVGVQSYNGQVSANGFTCTTTGVTWGVGDVEAFEIDLDAHKLWIAKNGTWVASGNPSAGTNPLCTWSGTLILFPAWSSGGTADTGTARFNAASFTTPLSTGFAGWQ